MSLSYILSPEECTKNLYRPSMLKRSVKNLSVLACAVGGGLLLCRNAHRTGINGLVVNGSENSSK